MSVLRRASLFYLIAVGFAWGWWLWLLSTGAHVGPGTSASHLPGLMGPALAAGVVTALTEGRDGLARLGRALVPRGLGRPQVLGLMLLPPALAAMTFLGMALTGHALPPPGDFLAYPGLRASLATPAGIGLVLVLNGFGEELGWRGYLLPLLLPRLGAFAAVLVVAGLWLFWHLPLFWLNLSMAALVGPMVFGWGIGLVLGAFALAHLWQISGRSIGTLALWHLGYNLCVATPATAGLVAAVVSTGVMLWGAWVALAWSRGQGPRA
jgi:uncharacterized protein